jgi:branched-chain amino acid transport system permease protein
MPFVSGLRKISVPMLIWWAIVAVMVLVLLWKLAVLAVENPTLFVQQVVNGLQLGFVYALIALGYTMIYGVVKLINFAHGDVFMVGSFISFYCIKFFRLHELPLRLVPALPPMVGVTIGTLLVILVSMFVCMVVAVTMERVAYRPLRNAPRIAALITAIGMSFFLEYFGALPFVFTSNYIIYERPFEVVVWEVGGIKFSNIMLIIIAFSIFLLVLLQYIVHGTKIGKAMRAVAYDKPTSRLMGINVDLVISFTFAVGAAFAGAAGVLYAIAYPQLIVFMGIMPGLKAFVAAVVGGIGNIPGAFVGGLIMGQAEVLGAAYISTTMRDAIAFALLIIVFLVRPTGIFGEPEGEKA